MCVIWTQKYHICGCIWNTQDLYCDQTESCWGARMLVFHCHLRTCKECWKSGDKRINQEVERRRKGQELEEEEPYQDEDDHDFDLSTDEEDFEAMHPSRPTTPELDLNPEQMPRWLFGMEVVGDVTKACEPVKLEKIWKDYRARRGKTDWYSIEDLLGEWLGPTEEFQGREEP